MEEMAVQEYRHDVMDIESAAMTVEKLTGQVQLIQQIMQNVMKEGEHYGVIPGTNKPTLLKPGAEKLTLTFRLDPNYDIIREIREMTFIAYTVKCTLYHIPTGQRIGSGIGSCNSREKKYRYYSENTERPVPKEYWNTRDKALLGGSQYTTRKIDNQWFIFEQVENENPWDLDNTLIKMACKRALVAATLNATAASDIFTQDVEDMPAELLGGDKTTARTGKKTDKVKKKDEKAEKQDNGDAVTTAQIRAIHGMMNRLDIPDDTRHVEVSKILNRKIESMDDLTKAEASTVITTLADRQPPGQEELEQ